MALFRLTKDIGNIFRFTTSGSLSVMVAITNYAILLHAEYEDSLAGASNLKSAVGEFVSKASPETLSTARNAWVKSREPYLQTEVGRFYDGPIEPIDGFINALAGG